MSILMTKVPGYVILSLHQTHTFRLITATLFPGVEFLFSITQVIDFRQGRTTCEKGPNKSPDQCHAFILNKRIFETIELICEHKGKGINKGYVKS